MALSDAEIGMFSIHLRKTIKGFFLEKKQAGEPGYNLEMNDSTLATMLLTSHPGANRENGKNRTLGFSGQP